MGGFSIFHWLLLLVIFGVVFALQVWPAWRISKRAGYNGAWSLLLLVPFVGLILMYVFAFGRWPILDRQSRTSQ